MELGNHAETQGVTKKATRRSVKKSRGGCSRCKSQHIKCDEARPQCGRCGRLGLVCPGYVTQLKWSTKHELNQDSISTPIGEIRPSAMEYDWLDFSLPPTTPTAMNSPVEIHESRFAGVSSPHDLPREPLIDVWHDTEHASGNIMEEELHALDFHAPPAQARMAQPQAMLRALGVRQRESGPRLPVSLLHQPYELISYYFKVVPGVYSTFDNHKNPFRGVVSSLYSHSLAVNLAAQSMAAAYLAEAHPRFAEMGMSLRQQCLDLVMSEPNNNYDSLLALIMSGPTGNWHDFRDLGLPWYELMRSRLESLAAKGNLNADFHFFSEAMILWETYLAFASDSHIIKRRSIPLPAIEHTSSKKEVHPWTGVGGDTLSIMADVARLVRANRVRSRSQKFVTQQFIEHMTQDLVQARELERRLIACQHPNDSDIVSTEDNATPIWHITTIADLHRYAALLQLYRVFPDLLSDRLRNEHLAADDALVDIYTGASTHFDHAHWLRAFSMEALRQLETIPDGSGTTDFQPILLVTFASELACETSSELNDASTLVLPDHGTAVSTTFAEVTMLRKFVVDRLHSFCRKIPPKPLRVCLDIIRETWRRIDNGQENVYWLDVMIENGWETIMA